MELEMKPDHWEAIVREPEHTAVQFSEGGARITKSCGAAAILRMAPEMELKQGKHYRVACRLQAEGCASPAAPYVMVSQLDRENRYILRMYAEEDRENPNCRSYHFTPEKDTVRIRLDLGLRGPGSAVFSDLRIEETEPPGPRRAKVAVTWITSTHTKEGNICLLYTSPSPRD